jgi:hypothetical protein
MAGRGGWQQGCAVPFVLVVGVVVALVVGASARLRLVLGRHGLSHPAFMLVGVVLPTRDHPLPALLDN